MICSDYNSIIQEIENLKTIWLKNAFPMRVIARLILKFFNKIYLPKKIVHTVENYLIVTLDSLVEKVERTQYRATPTSFIVLSPV